MSNDYKAIIAKPTNLRPIPGCDKIQAGTVLGYQVVLGIDIDPNKLGVFFQPGSQLSEAYAEANDLVRRKDANDNPAGGMFEPNRRVKSITLRGVKSEGFFAPIETLETFCNNLPLQTKLRDLHEGYMFDSINGDPICCKYIPRTNRRTNAENRQPKIRRELPTFAKHIDTNAFKYDGDKIPYGNGCEIILTSKMHGTSHRYGHVWDENVPIKRNWFTCILASLFNLPKFTSGWVYVHGSRNVILNDQKPGFYGSNDFRYRAMRCVPTLHKGEVLYGEIVGWVDSETPIMPPHSIAKLKDKEALKQFGETVNYTYGCLPGECKFYVYRITMTNPDGVAVEYSWKQVKRRCAELGIPHVPEICNFTAIHCPIPNKEFLGEQLNNIVDGGGHKVIPDITDPRHPQEGVVIRYESEQGIGFIKHKAFAFGIMEGYLLDDGIVDMETDDEAT